MSSCPESMSQSQTTFSSSLFCLIHSLQEILISVRENETVASEKLHVLVHFDLKMTRYEIDCDHVLDVILENAFQGHIRQQKKFPQFQNQMKSSISSSHNTCWTLAEFCSLIMINHRQKKCAFV